MEGCTPKPGSACDRVVFDDFLTSQEVESLIRIAETGMAKAPGGAGPTILDINSGWVLASGSHAPMSIYRDGPLFTAAEYALYREVTTRLKAAVSEAYGLESLYFTAPTFITREVGDEAWVAQTMHDEYWHPHVDKNSTAHYDYSGLVYLSTQGEDFTDGMLQFLPTENLDCSSAFEDEPGPCKITGDPEFEVAPRRGRLIVFGSGNENPHRVTKVTSGIRYVLSFWFTCDSRHVMKRFLDGRMHRHFGDEDEEEL